MSNFTPAWIKKGFFNESLFCDDFLSTHQLLYVNGAFFTPEGRVTDTMNLRCEIFDMLRDHIGANIAKRVSNVVDVLKLAAQVEDFPPVTDRIALANGTLYLDGTFQEGKPEIVRNRLPVKYDPKAAQPVHWLRFLSDLLYPEDIPTVQEFIGYCLIPSNKGQRMMVIKGSGGEGKSQIGVVLSRLFGCNMKDQGQRVQRCPDRQPAQVQSGAHQQYHQFFRTAGPGICGHRSPCAARPYAKRLEDVTPIKGEFGCFAAYVRTRQPPSLRTHVRSD